MTDRHTGLDRALAVAWALAWVGLGAYVALSVPGWAAWLRSAGMALGPIELAVWDAGHALRSVPGALLALAALLVGLSPAAGRGRWTSRTWFGLGLVQAVVLAVVCRAFFLPPEPQGHGELPLCGTSLTFFPVSLFVFVAAPLFALQAAVWSSFAWAALRAPRGSLVDDARRAAIMAALPAFVVTVALHWDGNVRWRGPEWLAVPVPMAASITACGVLVGVALSLRLREAAPE